MRLSKMIGLLLVGAMAFAASPVGAQPIDDQMRATARALADEGATFFDQGKYSEALDRFERADSIVHAPTVGLFVARTLEKLGRLVEASERYRTVMNVVLDDKAPEAFREAQTTASNELNALTPRIPSIEIVIEGEGAEQASVQLDGKPVPRALLGVKTLINPGVHRVEAETTTAVGAVDLTIVEKQAVRSVVTLKPKQAASQDGPVVPPKGDEKPEPPPGAMQKYAAYGAFGLGGVGLIMGIGAGVAALGARSDLDDYCGTVGNTCTGNRPDSEFKKLNSTYDSDRTLSTVGFVVGGVGIAAGVALLLTLPKPAKPAEPQKAHLEPWIGLGGAGFRGVF